MLPCGWEIENRRLYFDVSACVGGSLLDMCYDILV